MKVFWTKVKVAELGSKLPEDRRLILRKIKIDDFKFEDEAPCWFDQLDKQNQNDLKDKNISVVDDYIKDKQDKFKDKDAFLKAKLSTQELEDFINSINARNEVQIHKDLGRELTFKDGFLKQTSHVAEVEDLINNLNQNVSYTQGMLSGNIYKMIFTKDVVAPLVSDNELDMDILNLSTLAYDVGCSYINNDNIFCTVSILNIGHRYAICHTSNIDKPIEEQELTVISTENINNFLPGGITLSAEETEYKDNEIKNLIKNDALVEHLKLNNFEKLKNQTETNLKKKCQKRGLICEYDTAKYNWYKNHPEISKIKCELNKNNSIIYMTATILLTATAIAAAACLAPAALMVAPALSIAIKILSVLTPLLLGVWAASKAKKSYNDYKFFNNVLDELNTSEHSNTLSNKE